MQPMAQPKRVSLQPGDDAAARAAVVVLRAISAPAAGGAPATADRVRLLPAADVLTDCEAASRLAGMGKPVECRASRDGNVVQVACSAPAPDTRWRMDALRRVVQDDVASADPSEYARFLRGRSGRVLILGDGEYVPLEFDEFERFEMSYAFLGRYFVLGGPAGELGVAEGDGDWVRWYSASSSGTTLVPAREDHAGA